MLWGVFGFAKCLEKTTSGLGWLLPLTSNGNNSVLNRAAAGVADGKIGRGSFSWCVPHYTPNVEQQAIISKQFL